MNLDLTEAVEAAARARWAFAASRTGRSWESLPASMQASIRGRVCTDDLTAAAPIIARQVAEQIAAEIERARDNDMSSSAWRARQESFTYAARIAREAVR